MTQTTTSRLTRWRQRLRWPLVTKELLEQAARRRTYVLRVVYAGLLYLVGGMMLYEQLGRGVNPLWALGRGRELFQLLVALQFAGIYLFLPALLCGVIAQEKERDSLVLLLLTELTPWRIAGQKLLSRLLPMSIYLLLALPLVAVAYAFGGFGVTHLLAAALTLTVCVVQVGCIALMLSAYARSTAGAYLGTYLVGGLLYALPLLLSALGYIATRGRMLRRVDEEWLGLFIPPFWFYETYNRGLGSLCLGLLPALGTALISFVLAVVFVKRRALLRPRNVLLGFFRTLDALFKRANKLTGGVVLYEPKSALPGDQPVAWWELTKRAVGQPQYLMRILVVFLLPTLFVVSGVVALTQPGYRRNNEALSVTLFLTWPLVALLMVVQGASIFATERARQTLEVLLTTPMTGRELVQQKTAALRRLGLVLMTPLLLLIGVETWWETWPWTVVDGNGSHFERAMIYLAAALGSVFINLPMIGWLGMWIGMRVKRHAQALLTAVGALVLWVAGWPVLYVVVWELWLDPLWGGRDVVWPVLLSPATLIPFAEFDDLDDFHIPVWAAIVISHAMSLGVLWYFRRRCLRGADQLLGRV